ncbi:Putative membrane associated protein [Borrelia nietonii YOR]|uniref:Membrane associated protein n=1 Tax=Borrelia nietonii YOR TaxID=1293576 RepID=A0ABN4C2V4_9SPIR|nr:MULTISPECIES: vWA domain-containing protein [Borrelia]AHH03302.1 Putative membrane associated protein [Borrelia nietonii YOR]AHH13828.1 Putative membrane associated protein [Borrelia hermsii MTW]UPA09040.1 VWA domain-containing protein [Borrelia nietonii YOR]
MKKVYFIISLFIVFNLFSSMNDHLSINIDDVYVEAHEDGFHLFIRKKPDVKSVILTESFEVPDRSKDVSTYSFRTLEYNRINGDEIRILNGRVIQNRHLLSLTSSTPIQNRRFGQAFHILIPKKLRYGFPNFSTRSGDIDLEVLKRQKEPFWFSIRTFERKYNDYLGQYKDNAYELFFGDVQREGPIENNSLVDEFARFADDVIVAKKGLDIVDKIKDILKKSEEPLSDLDLVFVIDVTDSMKNHIEILREHLLDMIEPQLNQFRSYRVGFVFYKDYLEDFLTRSFDFNSRDYLSNVFEGINVGGGGDYPEAVFEGVNSAVTQFDWRADSRFIIVLGNAPPHEYPRGPIVYEDVIRAAKEKDIIIYGILLN